MIWQLNLVLLTLVVVCAIAAVNVKDLFSSAVILSAYSFFMCLLWVEMGAVDVGFTEAAASVRGSMPGSRESPGDAAQAYQVLPFVKLLVACWQGDEDFPSSYRVLFDAAAGRHLTTDAYAILGSMLTRRIIRGHQGLEMNK